MEVEPTETAAGKIWFSYIIYSCIKVTLRCQLNGTVIELLFTFSSLEAAR